VTLTRRSFLTRGSFFIRLEEEGVVGLGECSPLPGFSRETLADCESAFDRLTGALAGPLDGFPAALRFALETARLDHISQRLGLPAARALAPRLPRDRAPLSKLVPLGDLAAARRAVHAGFRTLKVKLGGRDFAADLNALGELRRAVGPEIALRLDANGRLDDPDTQLAALAAISPELVEEPIPAERLRGLARRPPVRIALDESLVRLSIAEIAGLLHDGLVDALVLKPTLLGGLQACLELAALARDKGARIAVSHLFDGPVALAAACALALAIPGDLLPCGLAPHDRLEAWPAAELLAIDGPDIVCPPGAGLGVRWHEGAP
jgi:o-succinylbenzoate synthase